jgi:hypothetical protein
VDQQSQGWELADTRLMLLCRWEVVSLFLNPLPPSEPIFQLFDADSLLYSVPRGFVTFRCFLLPSLLPKEVRYLL